MDRINQLVQYLHLPTWIRTLVDHNRWTFLAAMVSAILLVLVQGCEVRTKSPLTNKQVTVEELDVEVKIELRQIEADQQALLKRSEDLKDKVGPAYADLERRQQAIQRGLAAAGKLAGQYVPGAEPIVTAVLGIATLGLGLDNRRKDRVIEERSSTVVVGGGV